MKWDEEIEASDTEVVVNADKKRISLQKTAAINLLEMAKRTSNQSTVGMC
jgi:hypothetical protein